MKQLTCEMCGSTNLLKQDGVFVCQDCGTEYTVEEAKKMMIDGTVNVQGNVKVQNAAQLENLLNLAHSSFDSKNYAQAEEFCNQIIAMDAINYEAWKLKGEAINYQITVQNPRILEAFNCIMTSFKVLDDSGKEDHKDDILSSLKNCFEGEIRFWLEQFESGRPTEAALAKVKSSYLDSKSKMGQAFDELGFAEIKNNYLSNFTNYFISEANGICVSAWKTTVGYNYYRDDFSNLSSRWGDNRSFITPNSDEFRPTKQIWDTFIDETSNLISLLEYAESLFDNKTTDTVKENIFDNIAYFSGRLINSCSYKIQVGLVSGWSWDQGAGWKVDYYLNDSGKSFWRNKKNTYERKKEEVKNSAEKKKQESQKKKNEEYWATHAEEKQKLETEKKELQVNISKLESNKKELGLFKLKEKKAIQDQIDPMQSRLNKINTELTKNR